MSATPMPPTAKTFGPVPEPGDRTGTWTCASSRLPQYGTASGSTVDGGTFHDSTARIRPMTGSSHARVYADRSTGSTAA